MVLFFCEDSNPFPIIHYVCVCVFVCVCVCVCSKNTAFTLLTLFKIIDLTTDFDCMKDSDQNSNLILNMQINNALPLGQCIFFSVLPVALHSL